MKYYIYILYNKEIDRYYVGYTGDLKKRLEEHKRGKSKRQYTKNQKGSWKLTYFETYSTIKDANRRESEIKGRKSRKYIENLITRAPVAQSDRAAAF